MAQSKAEILESTALSVMEEYVKTGKEEGAQQARVAAAALGLLLRRETLSLNRQRLYLDIAKSITKDPEQLARLIGIALPETPFAQLPDHTPK